MFHGNSWGTLWGQWELVFEGTGGGDSFGVCLGFLEIKVGYLGVGVLGAFGLLVRELISRNCSIHIGEVTLGCKYWSIEVLVAEDLRVPLTLIGRKIKLYLKIFFSINTTYNGIIFLECIKLLLYYTTKI